MMLFSSNGKIAEYQIRLTNEAKAKEIVSDILKQEKATEESHEGIVMVNDGDSREQDFLDIISDGVVRTHKWAYDRQLYSRGTISTKRIVYPAAYTLSLAAQSIDFEPIDYCNALKARGCDELTNVTHGVNVDDLGSLLSYFDNKVEALNLFLSLYHPDLLYLRKYLECVSFKKVSERPIDKYNPGYFSSGEKIKLASDNTHAARTLKLTLRNVKLSKPYK